MHKNKRLLMLLSPLIVLTLFLLVGYGSSSSTVATASYSDECCADLSISISEAPLHYSDLDELLQAIAMAKFSEFAVMGIAAFDSDIVNTRSFDALSGIKELYMPYSIRSGFEMYGINVHSASSLAFLHSDAADNHANFIWSRSISAANATTDFFGRGAIAEYVIQRNGIDYYISEWVTHDTREPDGWVVAWAQNGQAFMASLPANFTEADVLAFCDAQAVTSWELEGNAVSISIQGMENVSIFENTGTQSFANEDANGITGFSGAGDEIIIIDNVLYRSGNARTMERVGYRWLIDEDLQRYQYVLQPGIYEFRAEGVIGQPGLLVQHFVAGNRVSYVDYSEELAEQSASQFYLTVTPQSSDLNITETFPNTFQVWNHTELVDAIQEIASQGHSRQAIIKMMQNFAATGSAIEIPAGVNVIFTSDLGNVFTYERTVGTIELHFIVNGTLTLENVTLRGSTSSGGIVVASGGHLIMEKGSIITNILNTNIVRGAISIGGTFTMYDGIIEGNLTPRGGVSNSGTFIMHGGIIRNNQATGNNPSDGGGGVRIQDGTFNMYGGIIEGNRTLQGGGGVRVHSGTFNMNGGEIRNNHAQNGGGIFLVEDRFFARTSLNVNGGYIRDNYARHDGGGIFTEMAANYQSTMPLSAYSNLTVRPGVRFVNNVAGNGAYNPPTNALEIMPRAASVSILNHQLNNHDVNFVYGAKHESNPIIFEVWNGTELISAMQQITLQKYREQVIIKMMQDFAVWTIDIPVGANIILTSNSGSVFTYTQTHGIHFNVHGVLTLENVTLSGGGSGGGVSVVSGGHLIMEMGSTITKMNSLNSISVGGINIDNNGAFTMRGGVIEENIRTSSSGIVNVSRENGLFTMYDGIIRNNHTSRSGSVRVGVGTFIMHGGTIEGNNGGGISVDNNGTFTMYGGVVKENTASYGGGVFIHNSTFNMNGGIIKGNTALENGGGIYIAHSGTRTSTMNMNGGEIQGNKAQYGGGIFLVGNTNNTTAILRGGYIKDNHAIYDGGGIFTERGSNYQSTMPLSTYTNLTIMPEMRFTGNTAGNGAFNPPVNVLELMPKAALVSTSSHQLNNYDINFAYEADDDHTILEVWNSGNFWDAARYISSSPQGSRVIIMMMQDSIITSGLWIPEGVNVTLTSNPGNVFTLTYRNALNFDIRGGILTLENITLNGNGTNSRINVNLNGHLIMKEGSSIINMAPQSTGIQGISGGVISIINGTFAMHGGIIENNISTHNGSVNVTRPEGTFVMYDGIIRNNHSNHNSHSNGGAGVSIAGGTFIMHDGIIEGNTALSSGGGVLVRAQVENGTFIMNGGIIRDNRANGNSLDDGGGGVFIHGGIFTMNDGIIEGNTAIQGGGVRINHWVIFNMNGGEIRNNHASGNGADNGGGGVYIHRGTLNMNDGKIQGNHAQDGGGVYIISGVFVMDGGIIEGNTATSQGGGVNVRTGNPLTMSTGFFTMNDGIIKGNTAARGGGVYIRNLGGINMGNGKIQGNKAQYGGGIFVENSTSQGTARLMGGHIRDNHAIYDGGGIFTERASNYQSNMPASAYSNLSIAVWMVDNFTGNTAGNGAFNPPRITVGLIPPIRLLNNYDINFAYDPNRIWNALYIAIFDEYIEESKIEDGWNEEEKEIEEDRVKDGETSLVEGDYEEYNTYEDNIEEETTEFLQSEDL